MARLNSERIDGFGTKTTAPRGFGDSIDIQVYPKIYVLPMCKQMHITKE